MQNIKTVIPRFKTTDFKALRPLVAADFLRPLPRTQNAAVGMQNTMTKRMFKWLEPALLDVFEQPAGLCLWTSEAEGNVPTQAVYAAENLDPSTIGWGLIYNREPCKEAIEVLASLLRGTLLIGFELSPYQKKVCDALEVPYISYAVHPLRFMSDYAFMLESNFADPEDMAAFEISPDDIKFAAQLKMADMVALPSRDLNEGSAVLFGQVDIDAALLNKEGRFVSLQEYPQALEQVFSQFETVYFKPHPYQDAASAQVQFLKRFGNAEFLTTNPYKLLAAPEIVSVAALTSSVLSEAILFNKPVIALSETWRDHSQTPAYSLSVLSGGFWKQITGDGEKADRGLSGKTFSQATLKSLLKVSWEDFGRTAVEPNGAMLPFYDKVSFGQDDVNKLLVQDGAWEAPSKDHRWMGKGTTFVSFRVPSGDQIPCIVEIELSAMATTDFPIASYFLCKGEVLAQEIFTTRDKRTITLTIPRRYISPLGDVVLEFNCNTGNSPKLIANVPDSRMLSLAFYNLKAMMPKKGQFIEIGQTIPICDDNSIDALISKGWCKPEATLVWSNGRSSKLAIVVGRTPDEDVELVLGKVCAFLSDVMPTNAMTIAIHGEVLRQHKFTQANNAGVDIVVPIPRRFLQNSHAAIDIDIELIGGHSPAMAGLSQDPRELGIMMQSVQLRSAVGALATQPQHHIANIVGPFNIHTGLAVMARSTFTALSKAMVLDPGAFPVPPRAVNFNNSLHLDEETGFVTFNSTGSKVNLFVGDVTRIERMVKSNGSAFLRDRYNIVYGAWELEQLPTYLADTRYINEFWGLSTFIAEAAQKRMDVPVKAFPIPVELHYPAQLSPREKFNIPEDRFTFLFTFSIDSTMARKNPVAVLEAFQMAFPDPTVPTCLVIKSMARQASASNREEYARFKARAKSDPRVILIEETLSRDENASLYLNCDAYISLHRAEGFGLTMAEAMGYGKPTIGTGYSGNLDFMTAQNSCLVAYTKVEMEAEAYHNQTQHWAEPDVYDAAKHMVRIFEDVQFREQIARAGKLTIHSEFSHEAVGKKLLERLVHIHGE